jgi:hypothetical protein
MSWFWPKLVEEGNKLYTYLINNFEELFDGNNIPHFYIRDWYYYYDIEDGDKINELYGKDIEKELIPWIKNEYKENRLFNRELWKPFRHHLHLSEMFNGYRKLFQYKQYYFQLGMESICENNNNCKYCIDNKVQLVPLFCLALYGWKKDTSDMLQPEERVSIPLDNIIPERDWKIK